MQSGLWALIAVIMPLAGAFLLPLAGLASVRLRNLLALVFVLGSLAASISRWCRGPWQAKTASFLLNGPLGLSFHLEADALAVFMALVSSLVGAIIVLYSWGYISHYEHQNEYYLMVVLFLGAMMGLVFARNLSSSTCSGRSPAIASWRLIGFFREKATSCAPTRPSWSRSSAPGDAARLHRRLRADAAPSTWTSLTAPAHRLNLAVALILVGILAKSATLPFHTWLPDAGVAPSPVTALLHAAVLVKIGVYVFARLFVATFALDPQSGTDRRRSSRRPAPWCRPARRWWTPT